MELQPDQFLVQPRGQVAQLRPDERDDHGRGDQGRQQGDQHGRGEAAQCRRDRNPLERQGRRTGDQTGGQTGENAALDAHGGHAAQEAGDQRRPAGHAVSQVAGHGHGKEAQSAGADLEQQRGPGERLVPVGDAQDLVRRVGDARAADGEGEQAHRARDRDEGAEPGNARRRPAADPGSGVVRFVWVVLLDAGGRVGDAVAGGAGVLHVDSGCAAPPAGRLGRHVVPSVVGGAPGGCRLPGEAAGTAVLRRCAPGWCQAVTW
ncbi:hypothetical protein MQP27_20635 [Streptomyces sp. 7R015]|uniref:Uncharacterized protein n=1 Tax=Streptomyces cylindrosporus TaxID=2927583 RepID=A0ABS9Y8F4_9ACTN|nr:hypothetical protein [Streptomyces cylindrosporus]MCI3273508.1 hypothetical protein [Streptomyces cylindrosporus]